MTAEALEEYYSHSAGLKPTMEMARVYDRYAHLTTLRGGAGAGRDGRPSELQRFAAEAYIGDGTKQLTDRAANLEATPDGALRRSDRCPTGRCARCS